MNKEKDSLWQKIMFKLKNYKLVVFILLLVLIVGGVASFIKDSKTIYSEVTSMNKCEKNEKILKSEITELSNMNISNLISSDIKKIQSNFTKLIQEYCNPADSKVEILSKELKLQMSIKIEEQFKHIQRLREKKGDNYFNGINGIKEVEKLNTMLESYEVICQNGNLEFENFCTGEEVKRITQVINKLQ